MGNLAQLESRATDAEQDHGGDGYLPETVGHNWAGNSTLKLLINNNICIMHFMFILTHCGPIFNFPWLPQISDEALLSLLAASKNSQGDWCSGFVFFNID